MDTPTINKSIFNPNLPVIKKFVQDLNSPWKMWLYFFTKLPSCLYWGIKIKKVTHEKGEVTIRMSRRTQNPFKSMYFAAQCGAAELSNGLLAAIAIKGQRKTSMLITNVEANFIKKATGLITFTCDEGNKIIETVEKAIRTEEGQIITVTAVGRNEAGQIVSEIKFTWSFKVK